MLLDTHNEIGLKKERDQVRVAIATMRILLGIFFILSGIANALYFNTEGGLLATVTGSKLRLWGFGFEGVGPLPPLLALPYAYLLIPIELVAGVSFVINRGVRWGRYPHDVDATQLCSGIWLSTARRFITQQST